jgi:hypothetical protein
MIEPAKVDVDAELKAVVMAPGGGLAMIEVGGVMKPRITPITTRQTSICSIEKGSGRMRSKRSLAPCTHARPVRPCELREWHSSPIRIWVYLRARAGSMHLAVCLKPLLGSLDLPGG